MTIDLSNGTALSDPEQLQEVRRLASQERHAIARLIAALGELDARRLYLGEGCSSLFTYCTQVLRLSEHAAYGRIEAARAARKWPAIFELLADGSVHLTAIGLLAPHLTAENHQQVLAAARHRSKREVEEIVASLRPQAPVPASVRRLQTPKALLADRAPAPPDPTRAAPTTTERAAVQPALEKPKPRAEVKPLAPEQYKVQFTVSRATYQNLREAQDLLRHRIPNGDVAAIFDRALTLLLAELRKTRHAASARPRTTSGCDPRVRHIPASVKREVWARDGGQCAFVGAAGRCTERGFLEYHHVVPFAEGGATIADNLELRCRAHNDYEAERWFGGKEEGLVREVGDVWI
jgi:5-methylcytosine-specific restriction endonuclease McrA